MELLQTAVPELYLPNPASATGLAYLLPRNTPKPPGSLSVAESWNSWSGAYLFLRKPVEGGSEAAFATAAWGFLEDPRLAGTRFAWLETPAPPALVEGPAIQVTGTGSKAVTAVPASVPLGSVAVNLAAGTAIALDSGEEAFEFTPETAEGLRLTAQWGSADVGSTGPKAMLPLSGPLAGCLQFAVEFGLDDPAAIDAGMRWFYAIPPNPDEPAAPAEDFFLESLRVPLLAGERTLYANLDPLAPLEGDRTFLAFAAADAGQVSAAGQATGGGIPSYLRTTLGGKVALAPLTGSAAPSHFAALVFARNQVASSPSPRDPFYLAPRGDFKLEAESDPRLMCGLSGVEYVELPEGAGTASVLSFFPGLPAFAAGFYPEKPPGYTPLATASPPTTSYAQVTAGGPTLTYFAQPDQSVLYNHGELAPDGFTALSAVAVEAGGIAPSPAASHAFPLLPYAGASGDLKPFQQLESQIVSPLRRKRIAEVGTAAPLRDEAEAPAPKSRLSTTPQGLLAAYKPGASEWEEVVLGRMVEEKRLELTEVKGDLLAAFQSNKLFLVVTDPGSVTIPPEASQIVIGADQAERWRFDLETAKWRKPADSRTILILKFHDLSIAELAKETAAWAPGDFNQEPAEVSRQIVEKIEDAQHNHRGDPDFAAFLSAVEDPHWNGILALNVECPLEELPSQLAGLAVGIDPEAFYAHHLGIALSKIDSSKPELDIEDSSIFGLLHYEDKEPLPPQMGEYAFKVRELKVSFLQSAVAGFSSLIELEVNSLFGEPATLQKPTSRENNAVELFGVYQKHEVAGRIEESYVFQTRTGQSSVFGIESGVLNAVTLSKGQFVTLTDKDTADQTLSQFVFWGQLDFHALEGLDAFSFGRAKPEDEAAGLAFGNLVIGMSFDPKAEPPVAKFEFDATKLSLDVAASALPREHSLFRHFPLTVASFTQGTSGTAPDGLGYMGVQTPLTQSTLSYPWFSLNYDLDLGSPGALAAEAGFVASLCVAWTPTRGAGYNVFTGLRLPGSSGAKRQISIEGLFDISFRSLAILSPAADTYALLLYGIGFQFLSFTFPPSGQVNFVLFGNPKSSGPGDTTIGWYAAYAKADAKSPPNKPSAALSAPPPPRLLEPEGPR